MERDHESCSIQSVMNEDPAFCVIRVKEPGKLVVLSPRPIPTVVF